MPRSSRTHKCARTACGSTEQGWIHKDTNERYCKRCALRINEACKQTLVRRLVECEKCPNTAPDDKISDGGYLASQFGWKPDAKEGWMCPVCVYGKEQGKPLMKEMMDLYQERVDALKDRSDEYEASGPSDY